MPSSDENSMPYRNPGRGAGSASGSMRYCPFLRGRGLSEAVSREGVKALGSPLDGLARRCRGWVPGARCVEMARHRANGTHPDPDTRTGRVAAQGGLLLPEQRHWFFPLTTINPPHNGSGFWFIRRGRPTGEWRVAGGSPKGNLANPGPGHLWRESGARSSTL